jgi:hypothetical protein
VTLPSPDTVNKSCFWVTVEDMGMGGRNLRKRVRSKKNIANLNPSLSIVIPL